MLKISVLFVFSRRQGLFFEDKKNKKDKKEINHSYNKNERSSLSKKIREYSLQQDEETERNMAFQKTEKHYVKQRSVCGRLFDGIAETVSHGCRRINH